MNIVSNHDLFLTLRATRDNEDVEDQFVNQFNAASNNYGITDLKVCFFRNNAIYMTMQWSYDHKYFQRMIERDNRANPDMDITGGMEDDSIG